MIILYIKVYELQGQRILACCDREMLGRTLRDGEIQFEISEVFYGRELDTAERLRDELARCTIANVVGSRAVGLAVECGAVREENVIFICGVPHVQMMRL